MKRLVVIDGNAILHRAFHAIPPLTTSKGQQVNAVYGLVTMILRIIKDLSPTHLVIAFDTPAPTFRNALYKEYQAKRPKTDEALISQFELAHNVVSQMGFPVFMMDGYEADDVIGTIVGKVKRTQDTFETIIVTGDRDLLQLVDAQTKVSLPVKGLSESKIFGKKEVEEKYGIVPSQVVDYKALTGDQSDNYPGVDGIGPTTAAKLIKQFGTIEEIYAHLEDVNSKKVRTVLIEHKKDAEISKQLATIVQNAPIKLSLETCKLPKLDREDVYLLFDELEFRSLISRLGNKPAKSEPKTREIASKQQIAKNKQQEEKEQMNLFS